MMLFLAVYFTTGAVYGVVVFLINIFFKSENFNAVIVFMLCLILWPVLFVQAVLQEIFKARQSRL